MVKTKKEIKAFQYVHYRRCISKRHHDFIDEGPEADGELVGEIVQSLGKFFAEGRQVGLIVGHRVGEVHEVIQVDRVRQGAAERDGQLLWHTWGGRGAEGTWVWLKERSTDRQIDRYRQTDKHKNK